MAKTKGKGEPTPPAVTTVPSLQPRPIMVPATDPYDAILGSAKSILAQSSVMTEPELVQASIRRVDEILKKLAGLQADVGAIRKALGQHQQSLRQAHPKGAPAEGTIKTLANGISYIYLDGRWSNYTPPPEKES